MRQGTDQELDAVAASAVSTAAADDLGVKCIVCITMTGTVAQSLARHQPNVPVYAFCYDPQVARRLQLHRSVTPVLIGGDTNPVSLGGLRWSLWAPLQLHLPITVH